MADKLTPSSPPPTFTELHPQVGRLFDMKFTNFVAPSIARLVYGLSLALVAMEFVVGLIVFSIVIGDAWVLLYLAFALVASFLQILAARIAVEWTIGFFDAVHSLKAIAAKLASDAD